MTVTSQSPRSGTAQETTLERPYATLIATLLIGLFLGSLVSQFISQRQVAQDLERLGERWRIADRSLQQLTSTRPTVDQSQSLLVQLQTTQRELEASVRAMDGLNGLNDDLASVRRQVAGATQQVHQIDGLVDTLESQSVRTIGTMQGTIQHLHVIEGLAGENGTLLPELEQSLASYLDLVRSLQRHEGDLMAARQGLEEILSTQRQLESLLEQWRGSVVAMEASLRSDLEESRSSLTPSSVSQDAELRVQPLHRDSQQQDRAENRSHSTEDAELALNTADSSSDEFRHPSTHAIPIADQEMLRDNVAGLLGGADARTELLGATHRVPSVTHQENAATQEEESSHELLDCAEAHASSLEPLPNSRASAAGLTSRRVRVSR